MDEAGDGRHESPRHLGVEISRRGRVRRGRAARGSTATLEAETDSRVRELYERASVVVDGCECVQGGLSPLRRGIEDLALDIARCQAAEAALAWAFEDAALV